jgi:hypothetical protein
VKFFWNFLDKGIFNPGVFPLVGGGVLGLLLLASSIFGSGLIRGFLQALFAGVFIGLVVAVAFEGHIVSDAGTLELRGLFQDYILVIMMAGFLAAALGCRIKIYHPRKILTILLCIGGGVAIVGSLVLPPTLLGQEGVAFVQLFFDLLKAPRLPIFWVVNLGLFALMGLLALSNALPFKSGFRSRLALLFGFYLLLYPLVNLLMESLKDGIDSVDMVTLVSGTRMYLIGFFAVWALLVGIASFLGNLTVALDYNEHMLLSRS